VLGRTCSSCQIFHVLGVKIPFSPCTNQSVASRPNEMQEAKLKRSLTSASCLPSLLTLLPGLKKNNE
jgi:hypothetical protein